MTFRNRKLLDIAHSAPCFAAFPHVCNQYIGCHPAHADWQEWGRGIGHKAPDWAVAFLCGNAHREIDPKLAPSMDREQRQAEWLHAFISTQDYLWKEEKVRVA